MSAILFAIQAFNLVKSAIGAGMALKDVYEIIEKTNASLQLMEDENRGPTDVEWNDLNKQTEELRAERPDVTSEGE